MFKLRVLCASLALALAAQAYLVESPNGGEGWVSNGDNTVTWSRVNTDPNSFDLILSNTNPNEFPQFQELLVSNVDGLTGSFTFAADGLPAGSNFRVNLNQAGRGTQGGILAQSNTFTISDDGDDTTTTDTNTSTDADEPTGTVTTLTTTTTTESATETVTGAAEVVTETTFTPTITETDVTTETAADVTISETSTATETITTTSVLPPSRKAKKARRTASPKWSKD